MNTSSDKTQYNYTDSALYNKKLIAMADVMKFTSLRLVNVNVRGGTHVHSFIWQIFHNSFYSPKYIKKLSIHKRILSQNKSSKYFQSNNNF